jgi:hypothetical protein
MCIALFSMTVLPTAGVAQADSLPAEMDRGHAHILQVSDAFAGAPGGQGLLRIALAEGEIAALHADLAFQAVNSLSDVRLHVEHMLHALDPAIVFEGPGLGYGLRRATEESLLHIEMAAASEGASDNLRTHAAYIGATLRAVLNRADQMVGLARDIQMAGSASATGPMLARLSELGSALVPGRDLDRDRLVEWQGDEGGLRQAAQHMTLLKRGEALLTGP